MSGLIQPIQHERTPVIIIKTGGSLIESEASIGSLSEDISMMSDGCRFVVVNGGGKEIDRLCGQLSVPVEKEAGLRVTGPEVLEIVQMALAKSSSAVAAHLQSHGVRAAPVPAFAAGMVFVEKRELAGGRDLGYVGKIASVDCTLIEAMHSAGIVPVVYPVAMGPGYQLYNVNADEIASGIASAISADALLLMTDVEGVLVSGSPVKSLTSTELEALKGEGHFTSGMIPKLEAASRAAAGGVGHVYILDGRGSGALKRCIKEGRPDGTEIQK